MKKAILATFVIIAAATASRATVITNTDFSYVGALTSNGWIAFSGADGSITSDGFVASVGSGAEDIRLPFADQGTGPTFASFSLNVSAMPTSGGEYSFGLIDGTTAEARFGLTSVNSGADFALTIYSGTTVLQTSSTLSLNTNYLVAIYSDGASDQRLWIDPTVSGDFASPTLQGTVAAANIDGFFIRQAGALDNGASSWSLGDLTIATTFDEVLPGGPPVVPTLDWYGDGLTAGGSGTWSAAGSNWSENGAAAGAWASTNRAFFGTTGGTVTVAAGGVSVENGIVFDVDGYTLTGDTVTLSGAAVSNNVIGTTTGTAVVSAEIAGTAGMTKTGDGTLSLSGNNSFSGGVVVSGGTLAIASDASLGDAANDLALNGTLSTTVDITLGAARDLSGTAIFDIANGTTLTVGGAASLGGVTLANTGTLDLQGATRSLGAITLGAAGTIEAIGEISTTGLSASALTSGTATINADLLFTSGDKTLNVGAGGTVDLNGALANGGGIGRIAKTGSGTLVLGGANSMGGVRIGSTGSSPIDGGTVIIENSSIGTQSQAIQLNYGVLSAASNLTFTNGLSIGGRTGAVAVLAGSDMDFQGQSSFFRGSQTSGELRLDVNNTTTFSGGLGATSGFGTATGMTFGGTGTLVIGGDGSAFTDSLSFGSSLTAVRLTSSNALAAATIVAGADKLEIATTSMTIAGLSGSQDLVLDTAGPSPEAVALTISTATATTNTGIISGSGSLTKAGAGSLVLGGANTYTGPTSILDGELILSLTGSLTSDVTVGAGGAIGGLGTIAGDLFLTSGADIVFDLAGPLIVNSGAVSFGGLGITDIAGLSSATAEGVYTLIDGTATFDFANVSNFGSNNAVSIGDGKFAYFSEGSLQVNVVPEPSTYALLSLAAAGLGAHLVRRRRR